MKNIVFLTTAIILFLLSAQSFAGYRIELHSGKYIVTNHFWEENGWIMFYQYGGQAGYPKSHVREITDTDMPEPVETPRQEQERDGADPGDGEMPADLDMEPEEFQAKVEQYQEELREVSINLLSNVELYKTMMNENNWPNTDDVKDKIESLQAKQDNLRRDILTLYEELPDWWHEIIQEQ
ncbi:MAG: hypothetical protein D5R98_05210 [Desulfonatronovibrio sp. MSAO_Bac4]|nr:MAG: hypothetical protein D5R98_05210 [Desulfonatronovibrio sp. MSAO_Bac4]